MAHLQSQDAANNLYPVVLRGAVSAVGGAAGINSLFEVLAVGESLVFPVQGSLDCFVPLCVETVAFDRVHIWSPGFIGGD